MPSSSPTCVSRNSALGAYVQPAPQVSGGVIGMPAFASINSSTASAAATDDSDLPEISAWWISEAVV